MQGESSLRKFAKGLSGHHGKDRNDIRPDIYADFDWSYDGDGDTAEWFLTRCCRVDCVRGIING